MLVRLQAEPKQKYRNGSASWFPPEQQMANYGCDYSTSTIAAVAKFMQNSNTGNQRMTSCGRFWEAERMLMSRDRRESQKKFNPSSSLDHKPRRPAIESPVLLIR